MKPRKPEPKKRSEIRQIMKMRSSEKAAENLFRGWNALEKGDLKKGLSHYLRAITLYGVKFNAVANELSQAKQRGFLPPGFPMPRNSKELEVLLRKLCKESGDVLE